MMTPLRRNLVLLDIDHTISDAAWRDPMIGTVSWDEYHAAGVNDAPLEDTCKLVRQICRSADYYTVIVTARNEKFRGMTGTWLFRNQITVDEIVMRPDNDYSPSKLLKVQMMEHHFGKRWPEQVAFAIDDDPEVCESYRAHCVTVLQLTPRTCPQPAT